MFIPHLDHLEAIVEAKNIEALDKLLKPMGRTQNKTQNFRSPLMLSAHKLKHLLKMESIQSDCIMLNLEDGVSVEQKPVALRLAAYFLSNIHQSSKKLIVRVNALDEGGLEEIAFLNPYRPDAIRIPKVRTLKDVQTAAGALDEGIELHLSIETKEAFANLKELQFEGRVKAVYLGILDLLADLGMDQGLLRPDNPTVHYLLSEFLINARIIGALPISFVYQDYKNMAEFKQWIKLEKMMGFRAKGCVSPSQAKEVLELFGTSEQDIERAHYIIELFEKMKEEGITGFSDDKYGFIDEPIYKGALKVVQNR